jgi:Spy/CpxP family protein refolding chaperone
MKASRIQTLVLAAISFVALPASAQFGPGMGGPGMGPGGHGRMLERMGTVLELTDNQKTAAKAVFDVAKTQAEPTAKSLREAHAAVQTAVKENKSDGEIDTLTARTGALMGQLAAVHAKAQREFRALLTPEQRTKLDALRTDGGPRRPGRNRNRNGA